MKQRVLKVHPSDNVIVALQDLPKGERVTYNGSTYEMADDIPAKHKFFEHSMQTGDEVIMYGVLVGKAQSDIPAGGLMTTANVKHAAGGYDYRAAKYEWKAPDVSKFQNRTFNGYHRKDGRVGTANYWLFIPTVFCENRNLDMIKDALIKELGYAVSDKYSLFTRRLLAVYERGGNINEVDLSLEVDAKKRYFPNVDGVKFLNHTGGCGGTREDASSLSNLLAAYADHPNVGGVTVLSLGCQHLQVEDFLADLK